MPLSVLWFLFFQTQRQRVANCITTPARGDEAKTLRQGNMPRRAEICYNK